MVIQGHPIKNLDQWW